MKKILLTLLLGSTLFAQKSLADDWTLLSEGSTSGKELASGSYYVTKDITFSNGSGQSGLTIASGATVHIYVPQGVTLTAVGGNADGRTGAGAGILLPSGSTLYLEGKGTVVANGGKAANGGNGGNGGFGYYDGATLYAGGGGKGGAGGGGAGAGIGTSGGTGGDETGGPSGSDCYYSSEVAGVTGYSGKSGGSTASMGCLYVSSGVKVNATGGAKGTGGAGGAAGDYSYRCTFEYNQLCGGGGGGGGGAGGGHAEAIGTGGSGGGGGASGAAGQCTSAGDSFNDEPEDFFSCWAGGGSGGSGTDNNGGSSGGEFQRVSSWSDAFEYWSWGKSGGSSGSAGSASSAKPTDKDYLITYHVLTSFGGSEKTSATVGYRVNESPSDVTVNLPTTYELGLTDNNYYVSHWNTQRDGSGETQAADNVRSVSQGTVHLYGEWKPYSDLFPEGSGTKADPFIINGDRLVRLADYVNNGGNTRGLYFRQESDITLNMQLNTWEPIGHTWTFLGDYDGGGHVIDGNGVTVVTKGRRIGIFGIVAGTIHHLGVERVTIDDRDNDGAGAIVGKLTNYKDVVTTVMTGNMHNCYAANNTIKAYRAGGLVGSLEDGATATHCLGYKNTGGAYNLWGIFNSEYFGGICGDVDIFSNVDYCFTNCENITNGGEYYATNCVTSISDDRMASGEITWLLNDKTAHEATWFQDLTGDQADAYPVLDKDAGHVYYDGTVYSNDHVGLYALPGDGTSEKPFQVSSKADLQTIAKYCNDGFKITGIHFLQTADIDLDGGHTTIGSFDGYYDGGGHTISNATINGYGPIGLFGYVSGTVARLAVKNISIDGTNHGARSGAIAGRLEGNGQIINCLVENCTVKASSSEGGVAGAIVGDMIDNTSISNSLAVHNTVSADNTSGSAGYLCGDMYSGTTLNRCYTDGAPVVKYAAGSASETEQITDEQSLKSGAYAYLLNNNSSDSPVWFQNVSRVSGNDPSPVLDDTHAIVYRIDGAYTNDKEDIAALGGGTEADPYKVATAADLKKVIATIRQMKYSDFYVLQTADIDMQGETIDPIGSGTSGFAGHYNGGGHAIKNVKVGDCESEVGLFHRVSGVVERLGIVGSTFEAQPLVTTRLGAFAGRLTDGGQLRGCYVQGTTVDRKDNTDIATGGLAGELAGQSGVESCYTSGLTLRGWYDGDYHYGHIAGYIADGATVSRVYTDGDRLCADIQANEQNITQAETRVDGARFQSGEVCYLLNDSKSTAATLWRQTLGTDALPVPDGTHETVYRYTCDYSVEDVVHIYTNSSEEPQRATVTLHSNPGFLHTTEDVEPDDVQTSVEVFKADARYATPPFKFANHPQERDNFYLAGWNTEPDNTGTFYPTDAEIVPTENVHFYAVWDMKVPAGYAPENEDDDTQLEAITVKLPENVHTFKVYDDGGKDKNYDNQDNGKLTLVAPDGYVLKLTGTISSEPLDKDGELCDYMTVYDGDEDSDDLLTNSHAKEGGVYYSTESGVAEDIGVLISSDNEMTIAFISDYSGNYAGLDLTVTVVPKPEDGTGTEDDPFLIATVDDLKALSDYVAQSPNGNIYVSQTADINMSDADEAIMIGTPEAAFRGNYDGQGYTLTVNYTTDERFCAPFHYTYGCTIRNLKTAGTIRTSNINAGGVVGRNGTASITLENVSSSVTIQSTFSGSAYHGGLVGYAINASLTGCAFTGSLLGPDSHHCGGLLGQKSNTQGSEASFIHCLYAPEEVTVDPGQSYTFAAAAAELATITGCYYTEPLGSPQGTQAIAFTEAPAYLGNQVEDYGLLTAYENGILFEGTYYVAPATVTLADDGNNTTAISNADGYMANVTLQGRTLYKDGKWNTLCLPFDLTLSGSPLDGATARALTSASIDGTTLNLTFGEAETETLQAGTPYIIKWARADDYVDNEDHNIVSPVFSGVTIDATDHGYDTDAASPAVATDVRVRFLGTYDAQSFDAEDKSILLMGGENTLYYPTAGASLGACRAYFKIGEDGAALQAAARLTSFSITFGDGETTGIKTIDNLTIDNLRLDGWYTLDGRRLQAKPSRAGVYINNGNKVVVK